MKLKSFPLLITLFVFAAPVSGAESSADFPVRSLSEAVQKNLTGLTFEEATLQKDLKNQAKDYVASRRGSMKSRLMWMAQCVLHSKTNYFCARAIEKNDEKSPEKGTEKIADKGSDKNSDKTEKPSEKVAEVTEPSAQDLIALLNPSTSMISASDMPEPAAAIAEAEIEEEEVASAPLNSSQIPGLLQKGDVAALSGATRGQIYHSLKRVKSWELLETVVQNTLKVGDGCKVDDLANSLGNKAEEFFPEPKYRATAISLYIKASECKKSEAGIKATYRLSLLQIWDGNCKDAVPNLVRLTEDKTDFASRGYYWRAHCAKEQGQKLLHSGLRSRLLKEYPLSYHGILMSHGNTAEVTRVLGSEEPNVRFRSTSVTETTPIVRSIEALQANGNHEHAQSFLKQLEAKSQTAEPEFRLYVAMLMYRNGDTIGNFRILGSIFKEYPSYLSQATLKLFYPLKHFEVIQKYGASLDPYFVAALIRQESGFNPNAMSRVGARGFMQLMPATARRMEKVTKNQLFNVNTNVRLGTRFFSFLVNRYDSDAELALAAYNAGPHRVDDWKRRYTTTNRMLFFDLIPFKETRDYVALISRNYYWYLNLYGAGTREFQRTGVASASAMKNNRTLASFDEFSDQVSHEAAHAAPSKMIFTVFKQPSL